jgi:DNA topoisomerase IB
VRQGRGFTYRDVTGAVVRDGDTLARIRNLVIPPAWQDVWICRWPNGHIQAVGTDAAGRRQYLYHADWRKARDREKHERVLEFASRLPQARDIARQHLAERGFTRDRVLASAFRLLDFGFFRVGGESYAERNGTYGLATMRREDVRVEKQEVVFEYLAKGSRMRVQAVVDDDVRRVVSGLLRRKDDGAELLAFRNGTGWRDVRSHDINDYVRELLDMDASAKDFRTWHATVLMAVALAVSENVPSQAARSRAIARGVREVSEYLGNTPAVCRRSYIDPRIIDLYEQGATIRGAIDRLGANEASAPATHGAIEVAVLNLLRN